MAKRGFLTNGPKVRGHGSRSYPFQLKVESWGQRGTDSHKRPESQRASVAMLSFAAKNGKVRSKEGFELAQKPENMGRNSITRNLKLKGGDKGGCR